MWLVGNRVRLFKVKLVLTKARRRMFVLKILERSRISRKDWTENTEHPSHTIDRI